MKVKDIFFYRFREYESELLIYGYHQSQQPQLSQYSAAYNFHRLLHIFLFLIHFNIFTQLVSIQVVFLRQQTGMGLLDTASHCFLKIISILVDNIKREEYLNRIENENEERELSHVYLYTNLQLEHKVGSGFELLVGSQRK